MYILSFGLLLSGLCAWASAAVIHVAKSGGDYSTVQAGVNAMNPGDTVYVKAGDYSETVTLSKNTGSADKRFIVKAFGADSVTVTGGFGFRGDYYSVNGFRVTTGGASFVSGAQHNVVAHCLFWQVSGTAIYFYGGSTHNTAGHCTIVRPGDKGCIISGSYNVFEYSVIEGPTGQDGKSDSDGIRSNESDHCVIRGNHVHKIFKVGSSHADVFQHWLGLKHLTLEDNVLGSWVVSASRDPSNAHMMLEIFDDSYDVDTLIIRRNIFLGGGLRSINVNDGMPASPRRFHNVFVYNNLFYTYGYAEFEYMINLKVKNNIFYRIHDIGESPGYRLTGNEGQEVDYNCIYPKGHDELHGVLLDPQFVKSDQFTGDFHLKAASPCINKGVQVGLTCDIEGKFLAGAPDIGPYEFAATKLKELKPGSWRHGRESERQRLRNPGRGENSIRSQGSLYTVQGRRFNPGKDAAIPVGVYLFYPKSRAGESKERVMILH